MYKRANSFMLALLMLCGFLSGCTKEPGNSTSKELELDMEIMQKSDPAQDDTLNILMVGSSFCYYYVEELWGMLDAAGIKANVCNVYYSGCPLESHWTWWKNGEANYEYFTTNETGRSKVEGASLEYCLQQHNWDVISLQESTSKTFNNGAQKHLETSKVWRTELINYFREQFPMSRLFWHQPWTYQVGYDRDGYQMTSIEQQEENMQIIKEYCVANCKELELERVNTGEAWQVVREGGYDNLCARLSKNFGAGDNYHDGDIGGGQYLNACVWFEAITGKSCIGNTYIPSYPATVNLSEDIISKLKIVAEEGMYTLSEELISTLQQAAHKAIEQRNIEDGSSD